MVASHSVTAGVNADKIPAIHGSVDGSMVLVFVEVDSSIAQWDVMMTRCV